MSELTKLVAIRGVIKRKLTRLTKFISEFEPSEGDLEQVRTRREGFAGILKEFEEIQSKIEVFPEQEEGAHEQAREQFEKSYYDLVTAANKLLKPPVQSNQSITGTDLNQKLSNLNLPKINLKPFSGEFREWSSFENTFDSLVGTNEQIAKSDKLHYLKSCLRGEASRAIENLSISESNYDAAWAILRKRFKHTRLIVEDHVTCIINAEPVSKSSYESLRKLIDITRSNIESLKSLRIPVQHWDAILIPIIRGKLDYNTEREWQGMLNSNLPTLQEFLDFLDKRCLTIASMDKNRQKPFTSKVKAITSVVINQKPCAICSGKDHMIYQCADFAKMSVDTRVTKIKNLKLCEKCLKANHPIQQCRSKFNCRYCRKPHNSLLHQNRDSGEPTVANPQVETAPEEVNLASQVTSMSQTVILSTAIVNIKDMNGQFHEARALLDGGSMSNFVSHSLCKKLGIKPGKTNVVVAGFSKTRTQINKAVDLRIYSRVNKFSQILHCLVTEKITENIPICSIDRELIDIPPHINLADEHFQKSRPVDLLIGSAAFWELLCDGHIEVGKQQPRFQNTQLGFILGGSLQTGSDHKQTIVNHCITMEDIDNGLQKLWQLDECHVKPEAILTSEQKQCENFFVETTSRDSDGRFIVRLPFKQNPNFGNSENAAVRCLVSLEQKLHKDAALRESYRKFMSEYLSLSHMQLVPTEEIAGHKSNYLPHHPVIKESSTTTKLRVVFNASFITSTRTSLNENLMAGPVIQNDLWAILLKFRLHAFVLNGDIEKMYRQIKVHPHDAEYQRIVWRDDPGDQINHYRLVTLTYGTKPASFIATRCLKELAVLNQSNFPEACDKILNDMYMDDLLTGADDIAELIILREQITAILAQGGLVLRKWASNSAAILPKSSMNPVNVDLEKDQIHRTLGLVWNPNEDTLQYNYSEPSSTTNITKRTILSTIARIYDPLCLISPLLIKAKVILQKLWSRNIGWDDAIPVELHLLWNSILQELSLLAQIRIPRLVITHPHDCVEIVGFSDASQEGYGAVIYLRTVSGGNFQSQILCAKSRVAPLKFTTIPRLELSGALLLARLAHNVQKSLDITISKRFLFSDSTIVLAWIKAGPSNYKTFVANRIAEIRNLTSVSEWRYVPSCENSADILSRGASPRELIDAKIWWDGPSFLKKASDQWPKHPLAGTQESVADPEKRAIAMPAVQVQLPAWEFLTQYSSFTKMQRVMAWCLRFIHNVKLKIRLSGPLTCKEIKGATFCIVKLTQGNSFSADLVALKKSNSVGVNSNLLSLSPFVDEEGLLRVGGRLKNAPINYDAKHPLLLPKNNHVSKLIIRQAHQSQLHAGIQGTLAHLRQKYWIISPRSAIRKIIHQCVICFRAKPIFTHELMGNLPKHRVQPNRPFLISGVDYLGPVLVKESRGRGKRAIKAYVAVFVCFSTKAVHLELVSDLTAEAFINTLKRFVSRRGHVAHLYSDNATNFKGSKRELDSFSELFKSPQFENVINNLVSQGVQWHFIPPRSPHMGGLWEVNVKCVKHHLKRIMGSTLLVYDELITLLARVEAILNSRPITPLTADANDLEALTPGHFLVGQPLTTFVDPDITDVKQNRLSRWQRVEQMRQMFWKRYTKEYLAELQQKTKWRKTASTVLTEGALVLVADDEQPPLYWRLGRVVKLHHGDDGRVRVAEVKVSSGTIKRSTHKLCALPINSDG